MTAKPITEEEGVHKEWMVAAKDMTADKLSEFVRHLIEDYQHDYGTICHAIAAAAVAAAYAVERSPQGGITGFQAGAVTWEMLRGWNPSIIGDCGARLTNYDNLLYPQYEGQFTSISKEIWEKVQEEAAKKIEGADAFVAGSVLDHWHSIAAGNVPFGLRVEVTQ